jgi:hypothetical protein
VKDIYYKNRGASLTQVLKINHSNIETLFRSHFGDQILSERAIQKYQLNCEGFTRNIPFVFKPDNEKNVLAFVDLCAQTGTAFYPISTGHNWGYGSSLPSQSEIVLVDLSSLDKIQVDAELGLAVVQPGVTPQKLFDHLQKQNSLWMVPITGAGRHGSLVGNALERGFGLNPIIDHFEAVISVRAVLYDGTIYESRLANMGAFKSDQVSKWKVGPAMEGLFSQSNFALVLSLNIQLAPRPRKVDVIIIKGQSHQIAKAVDLCQELRLRFGGSLGGINFSNRLRLESTLATETGENKRSILVRALNKIAGLDLTDFQVALPIYYSDKVYEKIGKEIVKLSKQKGFRPVIVREGLIKKLLPLKPFLSFKFLNGFWEKVDSVSQLLAMMKGTPSDFALKIAYSETPSKNLNNNPAQDGVGLFWFAPILRLKIEDFNALIKILERVLPRYQQKVMWTFMIFNHSLVEATIPIYFERDNKDAQARALQCWDELFAACLAKGFAPYRYSIEHMHRCDYRDPKLRALQFKIKEAFDPKFKIAPGRYFSI